MVVELASGAGVELPLAVAVGGSLAGVSIVAEVVLGDWEGGTEATDPVVFASELGVEGSELDGGSAFEGGVLLVLPATEPCASASTFAPAEAEREADPRLERLEVLLLAALLDGVFAAVALFAGGDAVAALRLGACWVAAPASGTVTAFSGALVAVLAAAGVGIFGAERLASATFEGCVANGRAVFSEPLRL